MIKSLARKNITRGKEMKASHLGASIFRICMALILAVFGVFSAIPAQPASAAANESFWGFNKNADGTTGAWSHGNLGKNYIEGEFVSYQLVITSDSKVWGAPKFTIYNNYYQSSSDAVYIDGFDTSSTTGFQWIEGEVNLLGANTQVPAIPWNPIYVKDAGQTPGALDAFIDFGEYVYPMAADSPAVPSQYRAFDISNIQWPSIAGGSTEIILFFRAHLTLDIIWWGGLEGALPTELDGDEFDLWSAPHHGSSFATGSSRHFYLDYPGIGGKTIPIPITEYPQSAISGYKYVNDVLYDGWEITLSADIELGGGLGTIPYDPPSVITGDTPWPTGYFEFTGLVAGDYTITEGPETESIFFDYIDVTGVAPDSVIPPSAMFSLPSTTTNVVVSYYNILGTPDFTITKTGDSLSKVGDEVTYTFSIENTGDVDLDLVSVIDTIIGTITSYVPAAGETLSPGEITTFDVLYTVQGDDPDPLVNEVTATYTWTAQAQDVIATDTWSVDLVHPGINIEKDADVDHSKVGDPIVYTITVTNTGDIALENVVVTDPMLTLVGPSGDTNTNNVLDLTETWVYTGNYTVLSGDPDPVVNTATVHADPLGYLTNDITDSDSNTVQIFQPSVVVIKDGDTEGIVGEIVTYNFTITNTSSSDSPDLILVSVIDDVLGNLYADAIAAGGGTLAPGASINFTVGRVALETDPSPLVNIVTVLYNPEGFPNEVTDSDDHSVVLYRWVDYDETFWAYGEDAATANNTIEGNKSNNWGWTNYVDAEGTYIWNLYADAGGNIIGDGFVVGTLTVVVTGGTVEVTYGIDTTLETEYYIDAAHLWVGSTPLPLDKKGNPTSSPGQFPFDPTISSDGLTATYTVGGVGGGFWIAAHGVVEWSELVPV